ncbi:hypothetical protein Xekk_00105 [Xenorhabdus sp. KK7.4]|nr:hypothetical protein Xekk_02075 [Xenorhabdus sp. KK7.4]PHM59685.1 hypothetical protein Xekk_00105 [Xenorhabdus sp. KK7.4]
MSLGQYKRHNKGKKEVENLPLFLFFRLKKSLIGCFCLITARLEAFFEIVVASAGKLPIMRIRCHDKHTNKSR